MLKITLFGTDADQLADHTHCYCIIKKQSVEGRAVVELEVDYCGGVIK